MDVFVNDTKDDQLPGVQVIGARNQAFDEILTPEALRFEVDLERRFRAKRRE